MQNNPLEYIISFVSKYKLIKESIEKIKTEDFFSESLGWKLVCTICRGAHYTRQNTVYLQYSAKGQNPLFYLLGAGKGCHRVRAYS